LPAGHIQPVTTSLSAAGSVRAPASPVRVVLLLAAAVGINYVDRGNLATAAPLIQDELHLSSTQLGFLLSAFFWTYVTAMAPAGWLAERYGARRVLAGGVAIWSVATLLTGLANGLVMLLLLRLLLGLGESTAFPSASKALASEVPVSQLGLANGVLSFGYLVGPAVGTYLGGMLMASFGWRPVFVLFGCLSLLWLWPWLRTPHRAPEKTALVSSDVPSFARILRQRGLWGASLGHFASNYNFYFILAWLPIYRVKARGFSMATMAAIAGGAYLINAISALLMGWATDSWCRAGRSPDLIYKGVMALSHVATIGCMIGMVLLPINGSIACLFGYEVVCGLSSPGVYAIPQILAGPQAAGRWVGVQNTCGNVAGIIAPALTGMLIDWSGNFVSAFVLAAAINVLGLVGWLFILPRIAPLNWQQQGA
jgi:MFS family permease